MTNRPWQRKSLRASLLAVASLFCLSIPAQAQNSAAQDKAVQDSNVTRRNLAEFDRFLDSHPEVAEQVRKDPSLLDNRQFVHNHPALEAYLQNHSEVRADIRQNPTAFMQREDSFDNNTTRRDVAEFNHFLDSHHEIAEQVRRDPSLLDNRQFVQNHPALETYLRGNPGVRDDIRQNPTAFMQREDRFDRENADRDHLASFGAFLGGHSNIDREVSENPERVKDQQYVDNHAELKAYLNANPDVRQDLMADPTSFVKGAQQYTNATPGSGTNGSGNGTTVGGASIKGSSSTGSTGTETTPVSKSKQ
jgi:hypothetical protein